jgi:hypothetical protein
VTIKFKDDGGTDRTITAIKFKDDGGTDRTIAKIMFNDKVIFITGAAGSLSVTLSTSGTGATAGKTGSAVTGAVVATPADGTAPYVYAWTLEEQVDGFPNITSPSSASTTFSISGLPAGDFCTATARCTVTDANLFSNSATCALTFYGG